MGAGSVVTKDVPPGTIVAGNPARILRKITEEKQGNERPLPGPESPVRVDPRRRSRTRSSRCSTRPPSRAARSSRSSKRSSPRSAGRSSPSGSAAGRTPSGWPCWGSGSGRGTRSITVPDTFIATAEAISWCGAKPVFVDVDPVTYNMDPSKLEAAITAKTRAVIPVHLFGQMADMDPIMAIARKREAVRDRGRLPGPRGGVQGEEGRLDRRRGVLQLLPGEEPRRLRGGRGRGHRATRNSTGRSGCCATTGRRRSITTP